MFNFFKKQPKKENYHNLISNFYYNEKAIKYIVGNWDKYWFGYKNLIFRHEARNAVLIGLIDNNKIIEVCIITPITETHYSGPFSSTNTVGYDYEWKCHQQDQSKIFKILNELQDMTILDKINKEKEEKKQLNIKEEKYRNKINSLL